MTDRLHIAGEDGSGTVLVVGDQPGAKTAAGGLVASWALGRAGRSWTLVVVLRDGRYASVSARRLLAAAARVVLVLRAL